MKKLILFTLLFLPLVSLVPVLLTFFEKPLVVYPNEKYINDFGFYADVNVGGNSEVVSCKVTSHQIDFEYIIREGHSFLYAGMCLSFYPAPSLLLDVSSYDYIHVHLRSSASKQLDLYFDVFQDNVTDIDKSEPLRPMGKRLQMKEGMNTYIVSLKSLKTPYYWLQQYNFPESIDNDKNRFTKVRLIKINEHLPGKIGKEVYNHLVVKKISFHKSYTMLYVFTLGGCSIYYCFLFFFRRRLLKHRKLLNYDPKLLGYKKLYLESYNDHDLHKIIDFITSHYDNPDFSPELVKKSTGISTSRINRLIRLQFGTSLIQFVNTIRITEVKRLLLETDRNIMELAFRVGFNNISYFNRLFKKLENISPREFRNARKYSSET